MTALTPDTAADSRPDRVRIAWQVGRAVLALLWLGWAGLAWWSAPRATEIQTLAADLDAGQVVSYQRVERWERDPGFWGQFRMPRDHPDGVILAWRTTDGQVHYAAPDLPVSPAQLGSAGGTSTNPDAAVGAAARDLDARGVPHAYGFDNPLARASVPLAATLAILGLVLVVAGPAPVRGTRPFWFWIGSLPFGLGALAWLAFEHPWTYRAPPVPDRRLHGWWGFGFLLVIGFGVSFVLGLLRTVIPSSILP